MVWRNVRLELVVGSIAIGVAVGLVGAAAAAKGSTSTTPAPLHLSGVVTKSSNEAIGFDLLANGKHVGTTVKSFTCAAGPTEVVCSGGVIRVSGTKASLYAPVPALTWLIPLCASGKNCSKGTTSATASLLSSNDPNSARILGKLTVATTFSGSSTLHGRFAFTIELQSTASSKSLLSWSLTRIDPATTLDGVSCPSASLCIATDHHGNVITSTRPAGGVSAWHTAKVDPQGLSRVSCASVSLCVAVDFRGGVVASTHPAGGAAAWHLASVDGANTFESISCTATPTRLCVAVDSSGNVVSSTNPAGGPSAWHTAKVDANLLSVSCATSSLCVAANFSGRVVTSKKPSGGRSAWSVPTRVDGTAQMDALSCPAVSLCVAVDFNGNIVTSSRPTGGTSAWHRYAAKTVDAAGVISAVSCASASLCVATDNQGNVVTSTSPSSGPSSWKVANVVGPGGALGPLSCTATPLCVGLVGGGADARIGIKTR